jgi:type III restriction enzyme
VKTFGVRFNEATRSYWVTGVTHLKNHGRWVFAEFCDVYEIESDFAEKVESHFQKMLVDLPK